MKHLMMTIGAACALALVGCRPQSVTLVKDGQSEYRIVIAKDAPKPDRFAAEELQLHFEKATGVKLEIVDAKSVRVPVDAKSVRVPPKSIYLTRATASAGFKTEECRVRTEGSSIVIEGEGDRGVPYGVYAFLERKMGVRWFGQPAEDVHIPTFRNLTLAPFAFSETPRMAHRYVIGAYTEFSRDNLYRNRLNIGPMALKSDSPERQGAYVPECVLHAPNVHTFDFYLPPTDDMKKRHGVDAFVGHDYFKNHPEWYGLAHDGKTRQKGQLCFATRAMRDELLKNIRTHLKNTGGEGLYDFSQNDTADGHLCYCPTCTKLCEKYDSPGGPLFDFYLKDLLPMAQREFPKAVFHFLAYRTIQTQPPPKIEGRFPDNAIAVYANVENCMTKDYSHPINARHLKDLAAWTKIAHVWAWYYPFTYEENQTLPFIRRALRDVRIAVENGLEGAYYEHDVNTRTGFNFADMMMWALARAFRDPTVDPEALIREYCTLAYGAAADDMFAYIRELDDAAAAYPEKMGLSGRIEKLVTPENLLRHNQLFDRMEAAVADEATRQRIREARYGLYLETLKKYRRVKALGLADSVEKVREDLLRTAWRASLRRRGPKDLKPTFEQWVRDATKLVAKADEYLIRGTAVPKPLPPELAKLPEDKVVQIFPKHANFRERVFMDDAAIGFAYRELHYPSWKPRTPEQLAVDVPYVVGAYDFEGKKFLVSNRIGKKDVVPDRFHLYKVGRTNIPSTKTIFHGGRQWCLVHNLSECFKMESTDEWDIYASLKFQGKVFSDASTNATSEVYWDRLVLTGPWPKEK